MIIVPNTGRTTRFNPVSKLTIYIIILDNVDPPSPSTHTDHQYPVTNMTDVPKSYYGDVLSPSTDKEIQDSCSQSTFDFFIESPSADDDDVDMVIPELSSTENSNTGITNGIQSLSQETSIPQSLAADLCRNNASSPSMSLSVSSNKDDLAAKSLACESSHSEEFERQMISGGKSGSTCTLVDNLLAGLKFSLKNNGEQTDCITSSPETIH